MKCLHSSIFLYFSYLFSFTYLTLTHVSNPTLNTGIIQFQKTIDDTSICKNPNNDVSVTVDIYSNIVNLNSVCLCEQIPAKHLQSFCSISKIKTCELLELCWELYSISKNVFQKYRDHMTTRVPNLKDKVISDNLGVAFNRLLQIFTLFTLSVAFF